MGLMDLRAFKQASEIENVTVINERFCLSEPV